MKKMMFYFFCFQFMFALTDKVSSEINSNASDEEMLDLFEEAFYKLKKSYVDSINSEEVIKSGIKGMVKPLDPYTKLLVGSSKDRLEMLTKGKYGGVGISIGFRRDTLIVLSPMENSPAYNEGIWPGDKIIQVDSISTIGMTTSEAAEIIRGEMGSEVVLHIYRPSEKKKIQFTLIRDNIKVRDVPYYGIDNDEIGYIRITRFSRHTANDFRKALIELKKEDIKGLVIDLRGNSGGLLSNAISILDEFVDRNTLLLYTKGRIEKNNKKFRARRNKTISSDIPISVLINKGSASASEIVSGALQDLDRAVIIGQKSFGKGLVQSIFPLNDTATLKITTQKYYTPSGRLIQKQDYLGNGVLTDGFDKKDTTFTTIGGRPVKGGGGISPDIIVKSEKIPPFVQALWREGVFLNFCASYDKSKLRYENKVVINDEIINDFIDFVKEDSLDYNDYGEYYLEKIKDALKDKEHLLKSENNLFDKIQFWKKGKTDLEKLSARFDEYYKYRKDNPLEDRNNKKWIKNGLEREFSRVVCGINLECHGDNSGSQERIRVSLFDDVIYNTAVELLLDLNKYYDILSPEFLEK